MPLVRLCETIWRTLSVIESMTGPPSARNRRRSSAWRAPSWTKICGWPAGNRIASGMWRGSGTRTAACETRGASAPSSRPTPSDAPERGMSEREDQLSRHLKASLIGVFAGSNLVKATPGTHWNH